MGPLKSLQRAEQQVHKAARRGVKMAKAGLQNATAGIRSSVRRTRQPKSFRTGIVSINGHDVEKIRCTGKPRVN